MIRITIELVPTGINELTRPAERIVMGCKFPLNSKSQELMVFSEGAKGYAELSGIDLDYYLYDPPDGEPKYLELANLAIGALLTQRTTREGGEFYPGMFAVEPAEFDLKIANMAEQFKGDIQTIHLFGKRVKEVVDYSSFVNKLAIRAAENNKQLPALPATGAVIESPEVANALTLLKYQALDRSIALVDGDYLRQIYPNYIPYHLAIKLDPRLYKQKAQPIAGQHFDSRGAALEVLLIAHHCTMENPNVPDTTCFNGLFIYYQRPDGSISIPQIPTVLTMRGRLRFALGEVEHDYSLGELKSKIKGGSLIYSQRSGQHKYPGVRY